VQQLNLNLSNYLLITNLSSRKSLCHIYYPTMQTWNANGMDYVPYESAWRASVMPAA